MLFRKLRNRLVLLCLSGLFFVVACQPSSPSGANLATSPAQTLVADAVEQAPALGTNLSEIKDWATQMAFLDAFKSARPWITQCSDRDPGCDGKWSTNEDDKLKLDDHGWVTALPAPEDPEQYTRVSTLMFRGVDPYPGGQYVVLYEGEGTIEYRFDGEKIAAESKPGRDVIQVTPSKAGILLSITQTDPNHTGDYIRNIHVVPVAAETTFVTEIFNPLFIQRIQPFQALRFMDWMETNDSTQSDWSQRPQVEDAIYSTHGAPLEIMLALANRLQRDAWFCMPHQATDEYMRNFAELVKANLDPSLTIYVEFSNEVWNWQFDQSHYALDQGKARWSQEGDAYMQWYGMRAAQMADIWTQVFADTPDRLVPVISTQTAYQGLEDAALGCPLWVAEGNAPCYQHGFKAYAITGYFTGGIHKPEYQQTVEAWLQDPDGGFEKAFRQIETGDLIPEVRKNALPGVKATFDYHQQVAQTHGLKLIVYEGGQHLLSPKNETLTEFFIAMNRHPRMYDMYQQLLSDWVASGGGLFMNFSDIYKPQKWGSWGVLETVSQEHSPKYDALMDFLKTR